MLVLREIRVRPKINFAKMHGKHLINLGLREEMRWDYLFTCRPKKSVQASPLLPTRQSLRLQKKNPEGLPSLETKSQTSSPTVDEHVSSFKVKHSNTSNLSLKLIQLSIAKLSWHYFVPVTVSHTYDLIVKLTFLFEYELSKRLCNPLLGIISLLPSKIF